MKALVRTVGRLAASYLAVVLVIILAPVFLIANEASLLDSLVDFIFQNHS